MFTKEYFDQISELTTEYFKTYSCGVFTLTIKAYGIEYNVVRFIAVSEGVITFAFYDENKSHDLSQSVQEKTGELKAWPAISIPYQVIESVEFNPGKASENDQIGFRHKE